MNRWFRSFEILQFQISNLRFQSPRRTVSRALLFEVAPAYPLPSSARTDTRLSPFLSVLPRAKCRFVIFRSSPISTTARALSPTASPYFMRRPAITDAEEFKDQMPRRHDAGAHKNAASPSKASAVTVFHMHNGEQFMLNFIDTPGHVDFHYEVQKALQACEGAILVVDATQGVQEASRPSPTPMPRLKRD